MFFSFLQQICCGLDNSIILTKDGKIFSSGLGADGQTGKASPVFSFLRSNFPVMIKLRISLSYSSSGFFILCILLPTHLLFLRHFLIFLLFFVLPSWFLLLFLSFIFLFLFPLCFLPFFFSTFTFLLLIILCSCHFINCFYCLIGIYIFSLISQASVLWAANMALCKSTER